MGKSYVMFVDERGFLSSEKSNNLTMVGVIFEQDYCINLKHNECELKEKLNQYKKEIFSRSDLPLDDIILREKVYNSMDMNVKSKFVNGLPVLLKGLKFTIITTSIKQTSNGLNDSYVILTKKLIKKFYSFILKKNGEASAIVMEDRGEKNSYLMQQNFFNVYNEENMDSNIADNIDSKINTFIVCKKNHGTYGLGIEILNVINDVFFRVSNGYKEIDNNLMLYTEYGNKNKIYNVIKNKIYKDVEILVSSKQLQKNYYNDMEIINKELMTLQEQLRLKDTRINQKEKEISELGNEIKSLNKRLEEVMRSGQNHNIINKILSDIDVKIKSFDKIATGAKN